MCGRYYQRSNKQRIAECFAANPSADLTDLARDYNVAPTTFQPVIRHLRVPRELYKRLPQRLWPRIVHDVKQRHEAGSSQMAPKGGHQTQIKQLKDLLNA